MKYFFVGGSPKSGTTWVQRQLDAHPVVTCLGEGHFHEFIVKPMYKMYQEHNKKMSVVSSMVYEDKPYYSETSIEEIIRHSREQVIALMKASAKKHVLAIGDKTPSYAQVVGDLGVLFPEMRFICVVRDPRDTATSRIFFALRARYLESLDPDTPKYNEVINGAISDWNASIEQTRKFESKHPKKILYIKYEDMLIDVRKTLEEMFSFIGIRTSMKQIDTIVESTSFEKFSGRKPGQEERLSFFRKGIQSDWMNVLSPSTAEYIVSQCEKHMEGFGYL